MKALNNKLRGLNLTLHCLYTLGYTYLGEYFNQPGVVNITKVQFVNGLSSGNTGLIYRGKFTNTNQNQLTKIGESEKKGTNTEQTKTKSN